VMINEMTQKECRELLARSRVGRLGCSLDNQPYVVPIYFAYDADYIYVFATLGQKVEWMRLNPKVCMQVDETNAAGWVSVIANGRYQELAEPGFVEERAHAQKLLETYHGWWLNALAERHMKSPDDLAIAPVFFRIHIESITGLSATKIDAPLRPV